MCVCKEKIVQAEKKRKSSSKRYGELHNINDKCGGIQEKNDKRIYKREVENLTANQVRIW
jgi:hypothetical protein